jgi:hypothetical protein
MAMRNLLARESLAQLRREHGIFYFDIRARMTDTWYSCDANRRLADLESKISQDITYLALCCVAKSVGSDGGEVSR